LESLPAIEFQDRLFHAYSRIPPKVDGEYREMGAEPLPIDRGQVLSSAEAYLDFLRDRFPPDHLEEDVEVRAYELVSNPDKMKANIISHLRHMWESYLEAEWQRNEPMLRDAVDAFSRVDLDSMDRLEAARFITGQALEEERWERVLDEAREVLFVPSAQTGPYLGRFWCGNGIIGIIFGARLPAGTDIQAPDLSRTEIVVRLSALADDTRLRILKLIAEEGEQRSQAIMDRLELSQSAASRHLKQLSATGYLAERRCAGAKCYRLNPERIEDTLDAVASFLIG
jgi:DNA-binding transcriptional ArsR family regulator